MRPSLSSCRLTILPTLALILLSSSSLTEASITCESPSSGTSTQAGSSISFRWGDTGSRPTADDVYSADATVSCSSSGSQIAKISSISNGQSWTVPRNVLDACGGGRLSVQLSGTRYDFLHWLHHYEWEAGCGSVQVEPVPVVTTTTVAATTTTDAAPTTTTTTADPTSVVTTAPVNTPTAATPTLTVSATPSLNGPLPGVLPPAATGAMNPNAPPNGVGNTPPDDSSVSSSSSESGPNNGGGVGGGGSGGGSGTSKAAMGALGAVGGLAAIAVMVFGLVLVKRRRRRQVREQRWIDHNYSSPTMSDNKGSGDYSGGGSGGNGYAFNSGVGPGVGAGGAAGLSYLEDQRDGYTAYHGSSEMTSSAAHHIQSAEYIIPLPAPPADNKDDNGDSHKNQQEISKLPSRPARTYQGEFDDPAPWDGQLGYLPTAHVPQLKQQQQQEQDLGFEYIRDYIISSDAHQQQVQDDQLTAPDLNDTSNSNNNRQLSTRASSQFPEDLEYFARLREASWPMPPLTSPASPTQPRLSNLQQPQQATILGTGSSPTQMPFLIPLPRTLSHSGAHQYDSDSGVETGAGASGGGDGDLRRAASPPGQQLAALNTDEGEVDVDGDGVGSTAAAAAAAADQHKMLSMRYGFENV